ncbi:DUF460 domain-containing protein [Candidatus Woesearchaeota archaeon]|nr:DUF460 domain-containing protein [Candidatus Woesearchaeota archaeon]
MTEQLLIIGIDPGTTVAFAALDLTGNLIKLFSQKEFQEIQAKQNVLTKIIKEYKESRTKD